MTPRVATDLAFPISTYVRDEYRRGAAPESRTESADLESSVRRHLHFFISRKNSQGLSSFLMMLVKRRTLLVLQSDSWTVCRHCNLCPVCVAEYATYSFVCVSTHTHIDIYTRTHIHTYISIQLLCVDDFCYALIRSCKCTLLWPFSLQ